jgi:hypothetical protein
MIPHPHPAVKSPFRFVPAILAPAIQRNTDANCNVGGLEIPPIPDSAQHRNEPGLIILSKVCHLMHR